MKIEINFPKVTKRHVMAGISLAWFGVPMIAWSSWLWQFIYMDAEFPTMSKERWLAFFLAMIFGGFVFFMTCDKSLWKEDGREG